MTGRFVHDSAEGQVESEIPTKMDFVAFIRQSARILAPPALIAVEERSERIRGTEVPPAHAGLPKLNTNRHTSLLEIVLTHWKPRATPLLNRNKIHFAHGPMPEFRQANKHFFSANNKPKLCIWPDLAGFGVHSSSAPDAALKSFSADRLMHQEAFL